MTTIDRRAVLRGALGGSVAAAGSVAAPDQAAALARPPKVMPDDAVGILYDSTLCIGCKACMTGCKEANDMPVEVPASLADWNSGTWDTPIDLSGKTLNVIKVYRNGTMAEKDRAIDGFAFVKRHCLHCVDPSCVSVCPVGAMAKDPVTGIVSHDPETCIGCRYCVYGCPFGVPQFDFAGAFGKIAKCEMCSHLQAEDQTPACCDVCPTGASLFGRVDDLQAEAERRLAAAPGTSLSFPRGRLDDRGHPPNQAAVGRYIDAVYGVDEVGGTQVRYLSGVPFHMLGLPDLPARSFAAVSEGIQHTIYQNMIAPLVLLAGLLGFAHRASRRAHDPETAPLGAADGNGNGEGER